mmetsp:Transcript_56435/g.134512  ORF Transcript_56435/g.134512 Transcript_56435/m.134512 type:complete len:207 (+) Transcript_56435:347-967(+)
MVLKGFEWRPMMKTLVYCAMICRTVCCAAPTMMLGSDTKGGTIAEMWAPPLGAPASSHQSAGTAEINAFCNPTRASVNSGLVQQGACQFAASTVASEGWAETGQYEGALDRSAVRLVAAAGSLPLGGGGEVRTFTVKMISFFISSSNFSASPLKPFTSTMQQPAPMASDGCLSFQSATKPEVFTRSMSKYSPLFQSMSIPWASAIR